MKTMQKSSTGLDANIAGALTYVLGFITGIIFLVVEKESEFVKFHARQSIVVWVALIVVYFVLGFLQSALFLSALWAIVGLISLLWSLVMLGLWLWLMFKAYQGEMYELPVLGQFAKSLFKQT